MYVCTYVCMYVCTYICKCVCMYGLQYFIFLDTFVTCICKNKNQPSQPSKQFSNFGFLFLGFWMVLVIVCRKAYKKI